jgi:hypothetical protein
VRQHGFGIDDLLDGEEPAAKLAAAFARDDDAGEVAIAEAHLNATARPRVVGEPGRYRVVEEFIDGNGQRDASDVGVVRREKRLDHVWIVCAKGGSVARRGEGQPPGARSAH